MTGTTAVSSSSASDQIPKGMRGFFKVLSTIEYVGNKLPHPFWLFCILAMILAVVSSILASTGVSVALPESGEAVAVKSMFSSEGLEMVLGTALSNFANYPALPIAVTVILGVSVAEHSGLLSALLRTTIVRLPAKWVTLAVAFAGMMSHVMFDAAFIVLLPLAALAFKAAGRSPILGIIVAFVSIAASFNASPLITPSDAILSAISTSAVHIVDPHLAVTPVANYYFSLVASVVLSLVITVVVETVLKRRGDLAIDATNNDDDQKHALKLAPAEKRGIAYAGIVFALFVGAIAVALLPAESPLRGDDGGLIESVVLKNIAIFIALSFVLVGFVYGKTTKSIKGLNHVPSMMAEGVKTLAPIIVLFFAISQFIAYFKWTGVGDVVAIKGAELLKSGGLPPLVLLLLSIILISIMNLLITSGTAMWSLLAPILVPMFMYVDISPEVTQAAFRIADSATGAMTPMSAYFLLALGLMQKYRKDAGIGTLVSFTIPLGIAILISWTGLFVIWYTLGIPFGPGT